MQIVIGFLHPHLNDLFICECIRDLFAFYFL